MKTHDDFRKIGVASFWVGNFGSEAELETYLKQGFEKDFGFKMSPREMPETAVNEWPEQVDALVEPFSRSEWYADNLLKLATEKGVEEVTTIVAFLNLDYRPEAVKINPAAPLKFLGTVTFC